MDLELSGGLCLLVLPIWPFQFLGRPNGSSMATSPLVPAFADPPLRPPQKSTHEAGSVIYMAINAGLILFGQYSDRFMFTLCGSLGVVIACSSTNGLDLA